MRSARCRHVSAVAWVALLSLAMGCDPQPEPVDAAHAPLDPPSGAPTERAPTTRPAPPSLEGMARVPAGAFWFGCNGELDAECLASERPGRLVDLEKFFIDRTEVTVEAYAECVAAGACTEPKAVARLWCETEQRNWATSGRERHPVNCVDLEQAFRYCLFRGMRLPTNAEWEKAARGTDGRVYPWGNEPPTCERAIMYDPEHEGCECEGTQPVGSRPAGASPDGPLDMAGSVEEWAIWDLEEWTRWAAHADIAWEEALLRGYRLRGGHYCRQAPYLRTSMDWGGDSTTVGTMIGFRCAYSPSSPGL
jgi:formylglycine-generating enzyme required for sulfatase activity